MTTLEELDIKIQQAAIDGFAEVEIAGQRVRVFSLSELIAWRKELIDDQAATRPGLGLRMQRIIPRYY